MYALAAQVAAKKLYRRMEQLGAKTLAPLALGDDQHPQGFEAALDPWLDKIWPAVRTVLPLPPGMSEVSEATFGLPPGRQHKATFDRSGSLRDRMLGLG